MPSIFKGSRRERAEFFRQHLGGAIIQGAPDGTNRPVGITSGAHIIDHTITPKIPMRGGELLNQISFREPSAKKARENIRFVF